MFPDFSKESISFKTVHIFGTFKAGIKPCFCEVSRMLFDQVMLTNGTINFDHETLVKKHALWSYIYYLYYYNYKRINVFSRMRKYNKNFKRWQASPLRFYETVIRELTLQDKHEISNENLILFINKLILENKDTMINPIIISLRKIMEIPNLTKLLEVTPYPSTITASRNARNPNRFSLDFNGNNYK
jgi:hypothetical protein